ncbi:tRNA-modifying protein YgfZ [Buchnera aphidicola (Eriosoma grossulariae)]|uniref:tRNA-modifying protein YgfZ n=1 Tax=Buchnera aphidicola TaxID=9 RepID=UPI003464C2CA
MINIKLQNNFLLSLQNGLNNVQIIKNWTCIFMTGIDVKKYLQGQLTIDIISLNKNHHRISAQCNIKGKILSIIRLFWLNNNSVVCILRTSVVEQSLREFKKYSIFSNINIFQNKKMILLGMIGLNIKKILRDYYLVLPDYTTPVVQLNNIYILWINTPIERFLLLMPLSLFRDFQKKNYNNICYSQIDFWQALDMASGLPIIDEKMILKFMPQSVNLDFLKGVDFNKGCYIGQEMIAKNHFLNLNKKIMYFLIGYNIFIPEIGSRITVKKSNDFYNIGIVLSVLKIDKNTIWIQAILSKKISNSTVFYLNQDIKYPLIIFKSIFYNIS